MKYNNYSPDFSRAISPATKKETERKYTKNTKKDEIKKGKTNK